MTPLKRKHKAEPQTSRKQIIVTPTRHQATPVRELDQKSRYESHDSKSNKGSPITPFKERKDAGSIILSLDPATIEAPEDSPQVPALMTANFDPKKYNYRPMYQKLSEVSEILDDQIDQYADIVLESYAMSDEDIGNPSQTTQAETIVVGRIVSDSLDGGRLNTSSLMLETSRRLGSGCRTKLDLSALPNYSLFPGQLLALKGTQSAAGFKVLEMLQPKPLPPSAALSNEFREQWSSVIIAAGPYTPDSNFSFEALHALQAVVERSKPSTVILIGPFIDLTHPMVRSGDIECDAETLDSVFQKLVLPIIKDFPGLLIVPHVNDALSRHACFPQEPFTRSTTGFAKGTKLLPNPALFSLDEVSYGVCSNDILKHLTMAEVSRSPREKNGLTRQAQHILQQRRFYPLIPGPAGDFSSVANLDVGFAGLTEFGSRLPDLLILPSDMTPMAKVIDGVLIINPGSLSKKAGHGTYAHVLIQPRNRSAQNEGQPLQVENDQNNLLPIELWKRVKVDITRI